MHEALKNLVLPGLGVTSPELGARVREASAEQPGPVLRLPLACESLWPAFRAALGDAGLAEPWAFSTDIPAFGVRPDLKPLPGVANIIAVASGKGGVGKSTVAVNLALALQAEGARVGLLDADIYGPSVPRMLGISDARPEPLDDKRLRPVTAHGLQAMSIGLLVDEAAPAVWRGPMATSALSQLLHQTAWNDLDLLVVDMPPGTGDIQLTLAQRVPVAGALVVTTPQDVALADARKGLEMFRKVSVPVLGVVENMSLYRCRGCGETVSLFGQGGGARLAERCEVALLGELPLDPAVGAGVDAGLPTMVADPHGETAQQFRQIAISAGLALARGRRDYSSGMPNIVVEHT